MKTEKLKKLLIRHYHLSIKSACLAWGFTSKFSKQKMSLYMKVSLPENIKRDRVGQKNLWDKHHSLTNSYNTTKIPKLRAHHRVSKIKLYMEKACYMDSPWLVVGHETQKWIKIGSAFFTKLRHTKPLCNQLLCCKQLNGSSPAWVLWCSFKLPSSANI